MLKEIEKNPYPKAVPNPKVYLEYNIGTNKILNEAELKALKEIEQSQKIKELEKSKNKKFKIKYNEMALSYKEEQKKKNQEEELIKKKEYLERMEKMQKFNKTLQKKNMKKKIINDNKNLIWIKKEKNLNTKKDKNELKEKKIIVVKEDENKNNDLVNLKQMDSNFIAKKTILKSVTDDDINNINNINVNINNDVDDNFIQKKSILKSSNENIDMVNIKELENNDNDDKIIDLRNNIENIINSKFNKHNEEIENQNTEDIKDHINERMNNLKRFRNEGLFPEKNIETKKKEKRKIIKNKKFLSEFEKNRFIKALKNIFTERLGEHNIYIQNICSCGNLQKQLTAIVEKGNLTVYALTEVECANNCVFYKNKKEYMKNINDVLNSIKKIKYENFHNKYKEIN